MSKYSDTHSFTPKIVESFRHIRYKGKHFSRRLRLSIYNVYDVFKELDLQAKYGVPAKYIPLDDSDVKGICEYFGIEYKETNTYFQAESKMCNFGVAVGVFPRRKTNHLQK